jgi:hypothetical protein
MKNLIIEELALDRDLNSIFEAITVEARISDGLREEQTVEWLLKFFKRKENRDQSDKDFVHPVQLLIQEFSESVFVPTLKYYFDILVTVSDMMDYAIENDKYVAREQVNEIYETWKSEVDLIKVGYSKWGYRPDSFRVSGRRNRMRYDTDFQPLDLIAKCQQKSRLTEFGFPPKPTIPLETLSLFYGILSFTDHDEFEYIMREKERTKQIEADAPVKHAWLNSIRTSYGGKDPFERYTEVGRIDQNLLKLIAENKYNNYETEYLEKFSNLNETQSYYRFDIRPNLQTEEWSNLIQFVIANFDAKLKSEFIRTPSLAKFRNLQSIYEEECVANLAYYLFNKSYANKKLAVVADFKRLIIQVTNGLIESGYQLTTFKERRLDELTKLIKKDSLYNVRDKW